MKLKIIFIISFSLLATIKITAQNIEETLRFADKQFKKGNYMSALLEYQRVAYFDNNNKFEFIHQRIGESFYAVKDFAAAAKSFDLAARAAKNDSLSAEMYYKKAMCYFKQGNYFFALNELLGLKIPDSDYFNTKLNLYSGIAWFGIEDYDAAHLHLSKIVGDESLPRLKQIFEEYKKIRKRFNPKKIQTLSTIFPGLGQLYCGNLKNGINSLVLIGSIAFVTVYIWHLYGFLDAAFSMGSWYYRYYTGGINNAERTALEKIAHEKEEAYHEIMHLIENSISGEE